MSKTRSDGQEAKRQMLASGGEVPKDVKPCWHEVAKAAQAACKGNNGFGILTITVAVSGNEALLYYPELVRKLHPMRAANVQMTAEMVAALTAFMGRTTLLD